MPPEQVANLYIGPIDRTIAGQPCSVVDFHDPDLDRFPDFPKAVAQAQIAELGPGDVLFVPSLYIHHVESLDDFGVLANFWWREGPAHLVTPTLTLMHAMMSLKAMPPREREAWRVMFDHFVFERNGDPAAHLPEASRGILGEMTPERLAWLRQTLRRSLGG
jgi:hypothetical protein